MKFARRNKAGVALGVALLGLLGLLKAGAVAAQSASDYTVGAHVCMPMNLPLAQMLQWRSEGVTNNNTREQWVVCPITSGIFDNIDITTRVSNEGDTTGDLQCLAKITTSLGDTLRSINRTGSIPPGTRLLLPFSNIDLDRRGESVSISCKLQPQFKIISFSVESSD